MSRPKPLRSKCGCGGGSGRVEITAQRSAELPHASVEGSAHPEGRGRRAKVMATGAATRETPGTRSTPNAHVLPRDVTQRVSPGPRIGPRVSAHASPPSRDTNRYEGNERRSRPRDRPPTVLVSTRSAARSGSGRVSHGSSARGIPRDRRRESRRSSRGSSTERSAVPRPQVSAPLGPRARSRISTSSPVVTARWLPSNRAPSAGTVPEPPGHQREAGRTRSMSTWWGWVTTNRAASSRRTSTDHRSKSASEPSSRTSRSRRPTPTRMGSVSGAK